MLCGYSNLLKISAGYQPGYITMAAPPPKKNQITGFGIEPRSSNFFLKFSRIEIFKVLFLGFRIEIYV